MDFDLFDPEYKALGAIAVIIKQFDAFNFRCQEIDKSVGIHSSLNYARPVESSIRKSMTVTEETRSGLIVKSCAKDHIFQTL